MRSTVFSFNKELMKQMNRSAGWVSIVYFIVLIFALPLHLFSISTSEREDFWPVEFLYNYNFDIQFLTILAAPVVVALFLFRFMQLKQSSDLMHSLPIKREAIFHQFTLTGLIYLIVPVLFIAMIVHIQHLMWNLDKWGTFSVADIYYWAGTTILLNTVIYLGAVLIGMITGISIVHGVLTYIFLLLPVGLYMLFTYNLQYLLFGFSGNYYMNSNIEYYSPLVLTERLSWMKLPVKLIVLYVAIAIVFYVLSLIIYKNRKVEAVSQALVFPILKPIFKFGVIGCTSFLFGMYFGETQGRTNGWLFFGYAIGSIIGFLAAEMVLQKTWRVFSNVKSFFYYALGLVVVIVALQMDVLGFEEKVPELSEIEKVHLSKSPYMYTNPEGDKPFSLEEKENLQFVRDLHQEIVLNKKQELSQQNKVNETAFFLYELKNGKKLVREYGINEDHYTSYYKVISESKEFKEANHSILHVKAEEINYMMIIPEGPVDSRVIISEKEDVKEALAILKEEVYEETYEETNNHRGMRSEIQFVMNGGHNNKFLSLPSSYQKFEQWLEKKGLLDDVKIVEDEIDYAVVVNQDELSEEQIHDLTRYGKNVLEEIQESTETLKITDPAKVIQALDESVSDPYGHFVLAVYLKGQDTPYIRSIDYSNAPEEIMNFFK
ncbi:DUF6449 domain-containing protein [Cytobacillus spongiae]|uniref:DUF6449 domain-containing protein n=1 Tax=Cytobacillus spongiae TaxID=2901381 RepID=UPI001F178F1B|nr:DUF6449 domain-containing protein [Cytobacillus spongiae]UII57748.1 DUF6449 domain-containing protein [Cytobacillus spongiae]